MPHAEHAPALAPSDHARLRAAMHAFGESARSALAKLTPDTVELLGQFHAAQRRAELHAMRVRLHQVQSEAATLRRAIRTMERRCG